jgi:hypothetical protein
MKPQTSNRRNHVSSAAVTRTVMVFGVMLSDDVDFQRDAVRFYCSARADYNELLTTMKIPPRTNG